MKLQILSDLHNEFGEFPIPETDAGVIVLAGDIGVGMAGLKYALDRWKKSIVYVAGNHEYYNHALPELTEAMQAYAEGSRVHFLENRATVIDGVRFVGCNLWADFALHGAEHQAAHTEIIRHSLNDFRKISVSPALQLLTPADMLAMHHQSRAWLEAELAKPFDGKTVVVTHTAPSRRSLSARFAEHPVSAAFASNLDDLVEKSGAALWIHGHTHYNIDYTIGATRVLTNQRGYPHEAVAGFRDDGVVEL